MQATPMPHRHARQTLPLALALCAALAHGGALAQPLDIEHQVQRGDTLEALSTHYLGTPRLWPQLQRHNQVANPRHLQPGSVLHIPMQLLPLGSAEVTFVQGEATVTAPTNASATTLQAGQPLPEGARVQVAPNSFVTVRSWPSGMRRSMFPTTPSRQYAPRWR